MDLTQETLSCSAFVSNAIKYLQNKSKIVEGEKKKCLGKLDKLKVNLSKGIEKTKKEMHDKNCTEESTGWYHNRHTGRAGIAILMKGKKKFVMEFGILDKDRRCAAQKAPPRGLVTIQNWDDSKCFYKGTTATLDYRTLIEFIFLRKSYELDHNYNQITQNCRTFVRDSFLFLCSKSKISPQKIKAFSKQIGKIKIKHPSQTAVSPNFTVKRRIVGREQLRVRKHYFFEA